MTLKRIQTADKNTSLIQDNVDAALTPLQSSPLIGGKILKGLSLSSGVNNPVAHNLGRTPSFFFAGLPNVNSVLWATGADKSVINLHCSASCIVSVWIT